MSAQYGIPRRSLCALHHNNKLLAVRFSDERRSKLWFRREDVEQLIENSIERRESA